MTMEFNILLTVILLIAATIVQTCEPDFRINYYSCDIKQHTNFENWQESSRICSYTTRCKYWTWVHADSSIRPLQCWLKHDKCTVKVSANHVSGDINCPGKSLNLLKSVFLFS